MTKSLQKTDNKTNRKRLLFRSWHRGTRELDLLLGSFAKYHLAQFSTRQLDNYEKLLKHSDPDLYRWITKVEPVPEAIDNDIMRLLQNFLK